MEGSGRWWWQIFRADLAKKELENKGESGLSQHTAQLISYSTSKYAAVGCR